MSLTAAAAAALKAATSNEVDKASSLTMAESVTLKSAFNTEIDKVPLPPPPPPPVVTKTLNPSKLISVAGWIAGRDRYARFQTLTVLRPDVLGRAKVHIFGFDQAAGGLIMWWDGVRAVMNAARNAWIRPNEGASLPAQTGPMMLSLEFEKPDGTSILAATASTDPLATDLFFDVDLSVVPEGWYKVTITGCETMGWSVADYAVYVLKGAVAQPHALCPSITASYEFIHDPLFRHQFAWVPTTHAPNYMALPLRETPALIGSLAREKLYMTEIGPSRLADIHRPCISIEGIWSTFHTQHYNFSDFERALPSQPVLDGRRGIGTTAGFMHVEWSTATIPTPPFNGPVDTLYFTDTWRFGKVLLGNYRGDDRGRVVTLCGYRHSAPGYRFDRADKLATHTLDLVGDWSGIPIERRGFRRLWGMAWDSRSVVIDLTAPTIPTADNLHPHGTWIGHTGVTMSAGVRVFLPDMGGNRICKLQFAPDARGIPPAVTEFVTGLTEVFDCVEVGKGSGILAVSVRKQNRIVFINMDDGAIVAQFPTLAPEGLAYQDGMLYYAALALKNIKKRTITLNGDVVTLGPELVAVNASSVNVINGNSNYMKIALDDGRFYQRGMIGLVSWSNVNFGLPHLFLPGENVTTGPNYLTPSTPWTKLYGPQRMYEGARGYQSCVGFGPGRMFAGTVQESLVQFSGVLPTDIVLPDVTAGYKDYIARGLHLTHGFHGWHYGQGVPLGLAPTIDTYLTTYGPK